MSSKRNTSGFTLVEVLIAVGITVLIVVLLGTMFSSLTSTTSRANQRIDAFRDARAALQMMEREMAGIVRADKTAYLVLDNLWHDGQDPYAGRTGGSPNLQLFALIATRAPSATTPGDVCAVGYYCAWDKDRKAYSLHRYFRNSKDTYEAIKPQISGNTLTYTGPGSLYSPANTDDVLASYVWNFRITAYKNDGTQDTTYPGNAIILGDPDNPNPSPPTAIEVSFNAISPEAARTVTSSESGPADWMNPASEKYIRLIKPHAYEFRTRITL